MQLRYGLVAAVMVAGSLGAAAPAQAAVPFAAHLAEPTVLAGSTATLTGTAPRAKAALSIQRLVGHRWVTLAHPRVSPAGTWSAQVRTGRAPAVWSLRVLRGSTVKTLRLRLTASRYSVSATANSLVQPGQAITIVGSVSGRATGSVRIQLLQGRVWTTVASPVLDAGSGFLLNVAGRPLGGYEFRVVKPFSDRVATGTSQTLAVLVVPPLPPAPPVITTGGLPPGTAELPYQATLNATGGVPPFTWSVTAGQLPAGLTLSPGGVLSGTPLSAASTPLTLTLTDALGRTVSVAVPLTVGRDPASAHSVTTWGGDVPAPVAVAGLTGVTAVSAGSGTAYALRFPGTVDAWGLNGCGQLGDGTTTDRQQPAAVSGLAGVTAIAAGARTGYALRSDGTVWAWGDNSAGQLGNGGSANSSVPVQVSGLTGVRAISSAGTTVLALKTDGTVWGWGDAVATPAAVPGVTGATAIAAGDGNGYAVAGGTVRAWGDNAHGQLGIQGATTVTALAAGHDVVYALLSSGSVQAWGDNTEGALGAGGPADQGPVTVPGVTAATAIAAGSSTGYALLADHTERAWGDGSHGQLGGPSPADVIAIGAGPTTGYAVHAG